MRLIDADTLGVGRCSQDILSADYCAGWNGLISILENAPTVDAIPVVRCRECKYAYRIDSPIEEYDCRKISFFEKWPSPEHFCSYGERRKPDEEK